MGNISTWSTTAGSNNMATPNGWPEGQSPSSVNDCARAMMAGIRTWYEDAQWINLGYTHTYASSTSFTIATTDYTSVYTVGRRIRAVGTSTGTIYGTITTTAYSVNTTVTITWDSGSLSSETLTISLGAITPGSDAVPFLYKKGAAVASATSTDIWNNSGEFAHITGTTTITSFGTAARAGMHRIITFDGILTLTHGASAIVLPGGTNITTAAGDMAFVVADTTTKHLVISYQRAASTVSTLTPGTGANNLVQLNGSSQLPAVSGVNLTGLAASQISGLILTLSYTSAAQTITDAGTITLTHGLGTTPKVPIVYMTCTTNNVGYTAGQTFFVNPTADITNVSTGNSVVFTSTTAVIRFGSSGQGITNPTNGAGGVATAADFTITFTFLA